MKTGQHKVWLLALSLAAGALVQPVARSAEPPPDKAATGQLREQRLAWWHEAKFGMFIHWGLYSQLAGEWKGGYYQGIGEWIMFKARIPIADYEQLARQFNPVKFDADAWAQLAQDAGMKYLIITSKHHDGFAMFGSQADKFNIMDATPFGRDPIKELAATCAKRNRIVADMADVVLVVHAAPGSKIETLSLELLAAGKPLYTFDQPANATLLTAGARPATSEMNWKRILQETKALGADAIAVDGVVPRMGKL